MPKKVFFSFQYAPDNWRVQQVLKMGMLEGEPAFTAQDWESVRQQTDAKIKEWINQQMLYSKAVVVLVGEGTADSEWVDYEIRKAWNDKRPMVGVCIHGLKDRLGQTASRGDNPFEKVIFKGGGSLADYIPLIEPTGTTSKEIHADIDANLDLWVSQEAYARD